MVGEVGEAMVWVRADPIVMADRHRATLCPARDPRTATSSTRKSTVFGQLSFFLAYHICKLWQCCRQLQQSDKTSNTDGGVDYTISQVQRGGAIGGKGLNPWWEVRVSLAIFKPQNRGNGKEKIHARSGLGEGPKR